MYATDFHQAREIYQNVLFTIKIVIISNFFLGHTCVLPNFVTLLSSHCSSSLQSSKYTQSDKLTHPLKLTSLHTKPHEFGGGQAIEQDKNSK